MKYPSIILSLACTTLLAACSSPAANPQPTSDTTQPSITAVNPVGGTGAATALEVNASDAGGIQRVEFWQGSAPAGKASTQAAEEQVQLLATDTSAPYRYEFSSANNGTRNYHVRVFDAAGNQSNSQTLSITVSINPPAQPVPDTVAPDQPTLTVSTTLFARGESVTLSVGNPTDNVGVVRVDFFMRTRFGEGLRNSDTSAPFSYTDPVSCGSSTEDGEYTYYAIAYDAAGNASLKSAPVQVRQLCRQVRG